MTSSPVTKTRRGSGNCGIPALSTLVCVH
jgi:hypothetical protein